ncbi:MAG TPA: hypothetical protein VEZ11_01395 [Thermoanaerobaculia bacterium]|nr:hypothetical protein [Thermoanaerobaculia bacterium]
MWSSCIVRTFSAFLLFGLAPLSSRAAGQTWRYDANLVRAGRIEVEAWLPASGSKVGLADGMTPFVEAMRIERGGAWLPLASTDDGWRLPECPTACHVRYAVDLAGAARAIGDAGIALSTGDAILSPPGSWLVHPDDEPPDRVRFRVLTTSALHFVTGVAPARDGASSTYESRHFPSGTYTAFGRLEISTIEIAGAQIVIATIRDGRSIDQAVVRTAVANAASAVARYYDGIPHRHLLVLVRAGRGRRAGRGTAIGEGGAAVMITIGEEATAADLAADWQLTHELVHLTFPSVARQHHWIEEGIATYVEPIARVQAGTYPAARMWRDLLDGLPKGEPGSGDRGLDRTHSWGRTYWGGALFCFVADVEIRRRTHARFGLQDALRAIAHAGGTIDEEWDLERALKIGDAATGTHVLAELYAAMRNDPHPVALAPLFASLGVRSGGDSVVFNDAAPEADIRCAIERGAPK